MSKQKEVIDEFIATFKSMGASKENLTMYSYLYKLSKEEFNKVLDEISNGNYLPMYEANMSESSLEVDALLKTGDDLGINFFEKLVMTDELSGVKYTTKNEYMILDIPVRRQKQHVSKGMSVATSSSSTDPTTGQVTGNSKRGQLSLPEIMMLQSAGLDDTIYELIKVRGGDEAAMSYAKKQAMSTGDFTLSKVSDLGTNVGTTDTLRAYLFGMLYENNL